MAEVNTDKGGGGKNKQKKVSLRVDFTPMVDMNMLLITFFMFCTTLSKPQSMDINMPTKDKVEEGNENKVRESSAITIILGEENRIFYYLGMPTDEKYEDPNFLVETDYSETGLRGILLQRNAKANREIRELKVKLSNKEITQEVFDKESSRIQDEGAKRNETPTVMIKPTDFSTYSNFVDAIDEMLVCNVGVYAVVDLQDGDRHLMYKKTGNPDYLTEAQKAAGK